MYEYHAELLYVVDGDTIDVMVDLGFTTFSQQRLRLKDIDTPELRSRDPQERIRAREARSFVQDRLMNTKMKIQTTKVRGKDKRGKYGRYIAVVFFQQHGRWRNLNTLLVREGHAKIY